jgi:hypothetical protein
MAVLDPERIYKLTHYRGSALRIPAKGIALGAVGYGLGGRLL